MNTTGTREQLAAPLVASNERWEILIVGTPGDWNVCARSAHSHLWLASERNKTVTRSFKTLDAAHAAAISIHKLADPAGEAAFYVVPVQISTNEKAATP